MRVALVHPSFTLTGGTERFGHDLARTLRDFGDEVHLFAHQVTPSIPGARHHPVSRLRAGRSLKLLSFAWASAICLRHAFQETSLPFDAVLGLGRTFCQDVLRVGGGCHAAYLDAMASPRVSFRTCAASPSLHDRLLIEVERRQLSLNRTRHIIAVSHRVKAELLTHYDVQPGSISVVHNGVDTTRFSPFRCGELRRPIRRTLGIPESAVVLLFVGNGLTRKGFFTVTKAFPQFVYQARARGFRAPIRFLAVGRDPVRQKGEMDYLQRFLTVLDAKAHMIGPQFRIEDIYSASDILTLPSCYEPFGNVCLEALASGLPTVTTEANGFSEILTGELKTLILEDADNPRTMTRTLLNLLDPDRRRRIGELGVALARRHTLAINTVQIRDILIEVASARRQFDTRSGSMLLCHPVVRAD